MGASADRPAHQAVGDGRVVEKAITEIGVLGAFRRQDIKNVRVEGPRPDALGGGKAEHPIPSAATGLKLGSEQFTIIGVTVRNTGRRLHAQQERQFCSRSAVIVEPVLAKQRKVADAGRISKDLHCTCCGSAVVLVRSLTDVGAHNHWQPSTDREIGRQAVAKGNGGRHDGGQAMDMHVVAMRGPEVCQEGIAQRIKFDPLERDRGCGFPLIERGSADGVDRASAAGRSHAGRVMSESRLNKQERCASRRYDEPGKHKGLPRMS